MSIRAFVEEVESRDLTVRVLNRTDPPAVARMLERLFDDQPVDLVESVDGTFPDDTVLLESDGAVEPLATSTLRELQSELLFVNSDTYVTGSRSLEEVRTPAVLANLDDVRLTVEGYPETTKGKLLLIEISRYIEARAWRADTGTLHAGFQRLSRIEREAGTRSVYRRLGAGDVDVHVYGVPDRDPADVAEAFGLSVHGRDLAELDRAWFVTYTAPSDAPVKTLDRETEPSVGLVACATDDGAWDAFWTFRPDQVADVEAYVERTYQSPS